MSIVFLDFEASSLMRGSFPIEIGWCDEHGAGQAHLIKPADDWTEWSFKSQDLHGITREQLEREGLPVEVIARRAYAAMGTATTRIYSDNPIHDGMWLQKLLDAGGVPSVQPMLNVVTLFVQECQVLRKMNREQPETAAWHREDGRISDRISYLIGTVEEQHEGPRVHRAQPDAERLWRMWRDVKDRVRMETK
jgi:hypothetical protein